MTKTIEITGGTLAKLAAIVIGFSALIFFLNRYDQQEKTALLKTNLELLDKSPVVKRIKEKLIANDSLSFDSIKEIMSELSVLKEEIQGIYFQNPQVIVEKAGKFLTISNRNHGYYTDKKLTPINGKTEAIIKELQKPNADVFSTLEESNKGASTKKIILPLSENTQKQAFLLIEYFEKS